MTLLNSARGRIVLSKKLKLKRRKLDGAYIFASVFAVIGGFALLGTYAAHNSPPIFSQGTYSLSKYKTSEVNTYSFGIKKGMTYCFSSLSAANNAQIVVTNSRSVRDSFTLKQMTLDQACFMADKTYETASITLPQVVQAPATVTVQ